MVLPTFSVSLLGGFEPYCGETALAARFKPRLQALVAYLLLHRDTPVSRQQLAFHFWPDSTEAQARTNVRKLLYRLRQIFPEIDDYLELERATIHWRAGAPLRLDVAEFEQTLAEAEEVAASQKARLLKSAVALYKGDLLPDLYDDWLLAARERLRQRYLQALQTLAGLHEQKRDYAAAIPLVRQLLREDPLVEDAYRRLMRLQALSGDVAGALRTYHRCVRQLEQELGVEPAEATQQAYRRLLDRREPLPTTHVDQAARQFPLVGRDAAWQQLLEAWRVAAAGRAQVVIVSGEAGIGKTRLVEELLRWTGRQGISTLGAACFAAETPLPLRPVADWLRSEVVGRALATLASRWRSELARLLPELLAADPALEMPRAMTEAWQQQHFFMALAEAVTVAGEPLLLFLDDLHWADADTLDWLHFLAQQKGDHRFLLVVTVRSEELASDHALLSWQQALARLMPVQKIGLGRLAHADTAALASSILGHSLEQQTVASLHRETEGNPLFTVEMVRAGLSRHEAPLPEKVRSVIEIRLSRLSPPAQEVAALAAVIGRRFAFPLLQAASPQSEAELLDSLDELWQRQIIREQGEDGYDFSHDKIREVALDRLSLDRRRWWHRRVANALEHDFAGKPDLFYSEIAGHYEAGGELEPAITYYHRAARKARDLYATGEALHAYRKALALLDGASGDEGSAATHRALLTEMGQVLALSGKYEEARAAYTEALTSGQIGFLEESRLHRLVGETYTVQNQFEAALAAAHRAEAALPPEKMLSSDGEQAQWLDLQLLRLQLAYRLADIPTMEGLIEKLELPVERMGTPAHRIRFLHSAMLLAVRRARYAPPLDEVLGYQERALAASKEAGDAAGVSYAYFVKGFIYLWLGNRQEAEKYLEQGREQAERIGYKEQALICLTYLSVLYRQRGEIAPAELHAHQSLTLARAGNIPHYEAAAQANLAWVAWRADDLERARRRGQAAVDLWEGTPYPFQWLALWPLLDIALVGGEKEMALTFAASILAPSQQLLPDPITTALESALQADEPCLTILHLQEALRLAREHRYL